MKAHNWLPILAILALVAFGAGCEGDQGPAGPAGPAGPPGGTFEFTYVGGQGEQCLHCHGGVVAAVRTTGHNVAYSNLSPGDQERPYCLQCHTTGWDAEVAFGDTTVTDPGPDPYGYDDYFGVDGEEAAERRMALAGVQCESCHGPMGPEFNSHQPEVSFASRVEGGVRLSLCAGCHDGQLEEWDESAHRGTLTVAELNDEFGRGSCAPCHTSEGYVFANDPAYFDADAPEQYSFIGCPTCHDPHVGAEGGGNEFQLRNLAPVPVEYWPSSEPGQPDYPTMEGYGTAQTCAQCHHGRRNVANVTNQIQNGYAHFGPHSSPQMDMFIGAGSYEIPGYSYDRTFVHQNAIDDACVKCHMVREVMQHGELQDHSFHNFEPTTGNCEPCHQGLPDFDYQGVQTSVQNLLDTLAQRFGYADAAAMEAAIDDDNAGWTVWQREAAYAFAFVYADGSLGVHNRDYAEDLLNNAIDHYDANSAAARVGMR